MDVDRRRKSNPSLQLWISQIQQILWRRNSRFLKLVLVEDDALGSPGVYYCKPSSRAQSGTLCAPGSLAKSIFSYRPALYASG